ncbi:MAG: NAD(P)H-dependent oxidoreductase [Desulfobacterales bacterium]
MLVLGIQGSPRKKSNTAFLLSSFMAEADNLGASTYTLDVCGKHIEPCKEYTTCERTGFCPIKDDMDPDIYSLLRQADVIVTATPIFFYNTPAQLKALIDRSQTLWARKYRLNLTDPGRKWRKGFLLAQGATKGANLFEGLHLTMKYFYDAVGAGYEGSLTYRRVENRGDMAKHPTVLEDVNREARSLLEPLLKRKQILFACKENACRSQMASAYARYIAGDRIDVLSAGSRPAEAINPEMVEVMQEKGIDMAFRKPQPLDDVLDNNRPDMIITMGCEEECPTVAGADMQDWDLPDPAGKSMDVMRSVRDEIERHVTNLVDALP